MRSATRWSAWIGVLFACAAATVMLWPLHAKGVTGNALLPDYHPFEFGWVAFAPLEEGDSPSADDLRQAGVRLPQDVVADRRQVAAALTGGAVVAVGAYALVRRRSPASRPD